MKPVTAVEVIVTYISLGWAYVMFTNETALISSTNFILIQEVLKEQWVLGFITLSLALIKIIGLTIHNNRVRWLGLVLSGVLWTLVAASMLVSKGYLEFNTGFIAYSGVAIMCLWVSKEVMTDGRADKRSVGRKNRAVKK